MGLDSEGEGSGRTATERTSSQRGNEVSQACYFISELVDLRGVSVGVRYCCNSGCGDFHYFVCHVSEFVEVHADVSRG